jgi:hypothetical protein
MPQRIREVSLPPVPVFGCDEGSKPATEELCTVFSEQPGTGEVDFADQSGIGESQITHRGEFVEIRIAVAGVLQSGLGLAQGFVLHLQFDPVHIEIVQQFFARACRGILWRGTGKFSFCLGSWIRCGGKGRRSLLIHKRHLDPAK